MNTITNSDPSWPFASCGMDNGTLMGHCRIYAQVKLHKNEWFKHANIIHFITDVKCETQSNETQHARLAKMISSDTWHRHQTKFNEGLAFPDS